MKQFIFKKYFMAIQILFLSSCFLLMCLFFMSSCGYMNHDTGNVSNFSQDSVLSGDSGTGSAPTLSSRGSSGSSSRNNRIKCDEDDNCIDTCKNIYNAASNREIGACEDLSFNTVSNLEKNVYDMLSSPSAENLKKIKSNDLKKYLEISTEEWLQIIDRSSKSQEYINWIVSKDANITVLEEVDKQHEILYLLFEKVNNGSTSENIKYTITEDPDEDKKIVDTVEFSRESDCTTNIGNKIICIKEDIKDVFDIRKQLLNSNNKGFFHLARKNKNKKALEVMDELIKQVCNKEDKKQLCVYALYAGACLDGVNVAENNVVSSSNDKKIIYKYLRDAKKDAGDDWPAIKNCKNLE